MIWRLNKSLSTLLIFSGQQLTKIANPGLPEATSTIGVLPEIAARWPSLGVKIFKSAGRGGSADAISV